MGNFRIFSFILTFLLQVQFCIGQELKVGGLSFSLAALSETDSIRLSGYISDCGEFGGHWEFIVLKKKSDYYSANFRQEPPCGTLLHYIPDSLKQSNDTSQFKSEIKVTEQEIRVFQKYFNEFPEIGSNCENSYSNARSEFSIETPTWQRARVDKCNRSKIFVILRDQLFVQ